MARASLRVGVLAAADVTTFVMLRAVIRLVRDDFFFGLGAGRAVAAVFPYGMLGGANFVAALMLGLTISGAYGRGDARRDPALILKGVSFAVLLALWPSVGVEEAGLLAVQGGLMFSILGCALVVERALIDAFLRFVYRTPADGDPIVFVGDRSDYEVQRVHDGLRGPGRSRSSSWVNIASDEAATVSPATVIARVHDALSGVDADTLVLCGEYSPPVFEAIVETATSAGVRVLGIARVSGVVQRRAATVWYGGMPFVELTVPGLVGWQLGVKRAMDLGGAILGLVVLSPLFALLALAVRLDSPGPVFFRQERVGYAGRVFRLFKFRTMRTTAEDEKSALAHLNSSGDARLFKIPNDPRVTRLGAWLRRWSLDELPQLLNVLRGEMSLVGPRPFFEADLRSYLDHHFARLGAKPGITGLWQVSGRSDVVDFEEVVRLDREYIERWSVLLDIWILLRTAPAVARGRGAF